MISAIAAMRIYTAEIRITTMNAPPLFIYPVKSITATTDAIKQTKCSAVLPNTENLSMKNSLLEADTQTLKKRIVAIPLRLRTGIPDTFESSVKSEHKKVRIR